MRLERTFYERNTVEVAKELLGCYLVHETPEGKTAGKIVETEAYLSDDPASHSFRGKTKRNASMFGPAGKAYVYLSYGMYRCFNVVTAKEHVGEAVLIRALEPVEGLDLMRKRRGISEAEKLCNGPGKLVIAMGMGKELDGADLLTGPLTIRARDSLAESQASPRIGITKAAELPLRFTLKGSRFVSRN